MTQPRAIKPTTWKSVRDDIERRVIEAGRHEYVPGETTHPMHTDPLCATCGAPKGAPVHA